MLLLLLLYVAVHPCCLTHQVKTGDATERKDISRALARSFVVCFLLFISFDGGFLFFLVISFYVSSCSLSMFFFLLVFSFVVCFVFLLVISFFFFLLSFYAVGFLLVISFFLLFSLFMFSSCSFFLCFFLLALLLSVFLRILSFFIFFFSSLFLFSSCFLFLTCVVLRPDQPPLLTVYSSPTACTIHLQQHWSV